MSAPAASPRAGAADPFASVVGQARAVTELRRAAEAPVHAYLLVGPDGAGTPEVARAFAAALLSAGRDDPDVEVSRVLAGLHPDLVEVEAEGATVRVVEAERLRDAAMRSPVEADRKVLVGLGFDVIQPNAAGLLLKTIEEPSPSTVIVLTAADVPADLVTVASRCVRVDLAPVGVEDLREALRAEAVERGLPVERADVAAEAAGGDLVRARVLLVDEGFAARRSAWAEVPGRLDGTGATTVALARQLLGAIDDAAEPLAEQQAAEREVIDEEVERYGQARGVLKRLDDAHKRRLRRFRGQELRYGLAVLAGAYRDRAVASEGPASAAALEAVDHIEALARVLKHNPNERLQLEALLARLPAQP